MKELTPHLPVNRACAGRVRKRIFVQWHEEQDAQIWQVTSTRLRPGASELPMNPKDSGKTKIVIPSLSYPNLWETFGRGSWPQSAVAEPSKLPMNRSAGLRPGEFLSTHSRRVGDRRPERSVQGLKCVQKNEWRL